MEYCIINNILVLIHFDSLDFCVKIVLDVCMHTGDFDIQAGYSKCVWCLIMHKLSFSGRILHFSQTEICENLYHSTRMKLETPRSSQSHLGTKRAPRRHFMYTLLFFTLIELNYFHLTFCNLIQQWLLHPYICNSCQQLGNSILYLINLPL